MILDSYGYVIGVEPVDEPDNYLFLTGMNASTNNLSAKTAEANAIFLDGTMDTIEINTSKSENAAGKDLVEGCGCCDEHLVHLHRQQRRRLHPD